MAEKTAGQWVGSIVGAVVGFWLGDPVDGAWIGAAAAGASIGGAIGGALDPPKGPHLQGPRLNDLSVQSASYGAVIPRVYGTVALLGNVFWMENDQLKETATTESQGGKGGGGGAELTSYSYSATFAVGLCQGPIAGVRRIWVGTKLIYDASATDISTIIASNQSSELFTLYKGTDTQLPDDRMQAALGVANTPAYRGLAYLVFKDFPLADHGNSMLGAQVKVEVVKSGVEQPINISSTNSYSPFSSNPGYQSNVVFIDGEKVIFELPEWEGNPPSPGVLRRYSMYLGGNVVLEKVLTTSGNVLPSVLTDDDSEISNGSDSVFSIRQFYETQGNIVRRGDILVGVSYYNPITSVPTIYLKYKNGLESTLSCPLSGSFRLVTTDGELIYYLSNLVSIIYDRYFNIISSGVGLSNLGPKSRAYVDNGKLYVTDLLSTPTNLYLFSNDLSSYSLISSTISHGAINSTALYVNGDIVVISGSKSSTYEMTVSITNLKSINQNTVLLSNVVEGEILTSNLLTAGDIDVTALTQSVRGYRVSSVAAIRAAIEPLQGAWPFDVLQSGYKIKFKPRGGSVVATIPASDLDARERSKAAGNALVIAREMDSIIPRRVVLKHMDVDREYDQGEQYAERLNTDAVNIQTVEMALAMTSTEAAGLAEVLLYLYWLERYDISFSLPPTYNGLEPADVITINTADASYQLRLTSPAYLSDGRLECSAKYNSAAIYTPTAIGESGQSTGAVLLPIGRADYALLDIPLLLDATDLPGFPVAMTGYLAGWSGGSLFRTDDLGQTWSNLQSFTAPGAVMGSASATIGAGRLDLIDAAALLSVYLISGELSSVTEAQLLGGANHFTYGADGRWEIIGAQNCVLQGDGSYLLSNLLRGRFGSEWACGLHQSGDRVVLLDSNRVKFLTANLNTIGQARTYRAITAGKSLSSDSDKVFTYTGVNLECLSPVYLNGNRHPSTNDWALTWLRRTRVGGEWRDYVDATLGEASEAYEVEIYSSAAYTTLKRTISSLTTPAASYTSAQQVTDFGSNQATLYVKVYQLSAVVGRGYPLTTSITR